MTRSASSRDGRSVSTDARSVPVRRPLQSSTSPRNAAVSAERRLQRPAAAFEAPASVRQPSACVAAQSQIRPRALPRGSDACEPLAVHRSQSESGPSAVHVAEPPRRDGTHGARRRAARTATRQRRCRSTTPHAHRRRLAQAARCQRRHACRLRKPNSSAATSAAVALPAPAPDTSVTTSPCHALVRPRPTASPVGSPIGSGRLARRTRASPAGTHRPASPSEQAARDRPCPSRSHRPLASRAMSRSEPSTWSDPSSARTRRPSD